MKLHYKYFTLILLSCFLASDLVHAQERDTEQGEIVMRQSELDSLLLKIVRYKKEQMAKESKLRNAEAAGEIDGLFNSQDSQQPQRTTMSTGSMDGQPPRTTMSTPMGGQPPQNQGSINQERIYNEFARLNDRIDGLILNLGSSGSGTSSVPPRQTFSTPGGGGQPNVIYMQPDGGSDQPTMAPGFGANATPPRRQNSTNDGRSGQVVVNTGESDEDKESETKIKRSEEKSAQLQNQISDLNEKIRVLGKLEETTESDEYNAEISELNTKIAGLKTSLEESNKAAAEEREKRAKAQEDRAALKNLRDYNMKVYFGNNATTLGPSDKVALEELAKIIKNHEENLTVMLHGFASKSGSAAYNNKISLERAEAVKSALRGFGIQARNIVTLPHGIDDGGDADQARRVEVSLRVI